MSRRQPRFEVDGLPLRQLSDGVVWNPCLVPWFNVNAIAWNGAEDELEAIMVPTFPELKTILAQQNAFFKIVSIDYVTPGQMNESGQWQMETLIELTELRDSLGWSTPRCKVEGDRVYRGLTLETKPVESSEHLIYSLL